MASEEELCAKQPAPPPAPEAGASVGVCGPKHCEHWGARALAAESEIARLTALVEEHADTMDKLTAAEARLADAVRLFQDFATWFEESVKTNPKDDSFTGRLSDVASLFARLDAFLGVGAAAKLTGLAPEEMNLSEDDKRRLSGYYASIGRPLDTQPAAPASGKLAGYCIMCGVPWPCSVAAPAAPASGVLAKLQRAHEIVSAVARDRSAWRMSIPARPDYDTDLLLSDAISAAENEIRAADAAYRLVEEVVKITPDYDESEFVVLQIPRITLNAMRALVAQKD